MAGASPHFRHPGWIMTHVGQIAMLRRLSGNPLRAENYFKADIAAGRVGAAQMAPKREFD